MALALGLGLTGNGRQHARTDVQGLAGALPIDHSNGFGAVRGGQDVPKQGQLLARQGQQARHSATISERPRRQRLGAGDALGSIGHAIGCRRWRVVPGKGTGREGRGVGVLLVRPLVKGGAPRASLGGAIVTCVVGVLLGPGVGRREGSSPGGA
jgi:hypothetical protein